VFGLVRKRSGVNIAGGEYKASIFFNKLFAFSSHREPVPARSFMLALSLPVCCTTLKTLSAGKPVLLIYARTVEAFPKCALAFCALNLVRQRETFIAALTANPAVLHSKGGLSCQREQVGKGVCK